MAVRFQIPENTNYSTKFLSCRREPSPYPGNERCYESTPTPSDNGYSMSAYFKAVKSFFSTIHQPKKVPNTAKPQVADKKEAKRKAHLEWEAARRNAMDIGSRPLCTGCPLCDTRRFRNSSVTLFEIERKEARRATIDGMGNREGDKVGDPFQEDKRGWGDVLAWMHEERVNIAGFRTTEREREACRNGGCKCLGPLVRDV